MHGPHLKQNVLMINNQEGCKSTDINGFPYAGLQRDVGQEDFAVGKNTSHLHTLYLYKQHRSAVENKNLYYSSINICLHLHHNFHKIVIYLKSCTSQNFSNTDHTQKIRYCIFLKEHQFICSFCFIFVSVCKYFPTWHPNSFSHCRIQFK